MKRALLIAVTLLPFVVAMAAWADDVHMTAGPGNPAAAGTISVDHDHNGNTEIKIRAHHLAKPDALDTAKTTYVVWVQPKDRSPENVGEMKIDKNLDGEFRTVTPYKQFDVIITAEDSPRPTEPSSTAVLRGLVEK